VSNLFGFFGFICLLQSIKKATGLGGFFQDCVAQALLPVINKTYVDRRRPRLRCASAPLKPAWLGWESRRL